MKTATNPAEPFGIGTDTPLAGTDREAMAAVLGFDPEEEVQKEDAKGHIIK